MKKSNTQLRAVEENEIQDHHHREQFAAYIARVIADKRTSQDVRNVIGGIIISSISNNSGYAWNTDTEGLRFMLPRLLAEMNEMFADGIIEATMEAVDELLPHDIGREHWKASAKDLEQ